MGDRANVYVKDGDVGVYLYTHWSGTELPETLRTALIRAADRRTDTAYLARIILDEMTGMTGGTTGFGISASMCDNEHPILIVNSDEETVQLGKEPEGHGAPLPTGEKWTMEAYMKLSKPVTYRALGDDD